MGKRKTKPERLALPIFQTIVEMHSHDWRQVYTNVAESVDALLGEKVVPSQLRRHVHGKYVITSQHASGSEAEKPDRNWIDELIYITQHTADRREHA